eukprot:UN03923
MILLHSKTSLYCCSYLYSHSFYFIQNMQHMDSTIIAHFCVYLNYLVVYIINNRKHNTYQLIKHENFNPPIVLYRDITLFDFFVAKSPLSSM